MALMAGGNWRKSVDYLRERYRDILIISDAKRGDIGNTSGAYARAIFDELGFDAVTLNPYLGRDALEPFLDYADKACIILCRTSNPGAAELQNLSLNGRPLWQIVAEKRREHGTQTAIACWSRLAGIRRKWRRFAQLPAR